MILIFCMSLIYIQLLPRSTAMLMVGGARKASGRSRTAVLPSSSPVSTDPWKVLVKKLGSEKASGGSVGRTKKIEAANGLVDELRCKHFESCSGCSLKGNLRY